MLAEVRHHQGEIPRRSAPRNDIFASGLSSYHSPEVESSQKSSISVNTARFHIKNIYGKLSVHGRSEAIQQARELGLL